MSLRVCAEPNCPNLQAEARCVRHRREREQQRGTRQQRGYDAEYDRLHREYQQRMDSGEGIPCWSCPELGWEPHVVDPQHWHLGHHPTDRGIIRGPQCPESNLHLAGISPMRYGGGG